MANVDNIAIARKLTIFSSSSSFSIKLFSILYLKNIGYVRFQTDTKQLPVLGSLTEAKSLFYSSNFIQHSYLKNCGHSFFIPIPNSYFVCMILNFYFLGVKFFIESTIVNILLLFITM